ncbi:MAG: YbaB/EbfC family nucleoid-associated protein [Planctomycetota bacterium]
MFGMKGMGDIMKLMGQREKIAENMEQAKIRARNRNVMGASGGGLVKVIANGLGDIIAVEFDPEALKDAESLGPLVVAASNIAVAKSKEVLAEELRTAMGGIDLPPGLLS